MALIKSVHRDSILKEFYESSATKRRPYTGFCCKPSVVGVATWKVSVVQKSRCDDEEAFKKVNTYFYRVLFETYKTFHSH